MNVKNIKEFRTFYKEKVREIDSSNRNEHFPGVKFKEKGKNQYGFFDIYHGDKDKLKAEGIRGFLEGFLDMARDAQAVYEFMQNAVDANSSHFAMFWGEDESDGNEYLLVFNNGAQFNFPAVRSILNVGVSTKNPEDHTIGKFGIGFKLSHRLVGKTNGLDELIHNNYGPIVFSWKNNEIKNLESGNGQINLIDQKYSIEELDGEDIPKCITTDPWLFKILVTNFPCHPGEELWDVEHKKKSIAFSDSELNRLQAWVKKYLPNLPVEKYNEGSLFFIRLGEGKQEHLQDTNLEAGVRFSLSVLNHISRTNNRGLKDINLNGKALESVDLNYLKFSPIDKDSDEYKQIRFGKTEGLSDSELNTIEKEDDIEFLMGYTNYQQAIKQFENAPNLYLYFPLSEEKHELKFIIHCNAFYKASHRTSLHVGAEGKFDINERLLKAFGEKLITKLNDLSSSTKEEDKNDFLNIYGNLLLSDKSIEPNRQWINEPLVDTLQKYIKGNIPVLTAADNMSFDISKSPEQVKINLTSVSFSPEDWGLDFSWFYWSDKKSSILLEEAKKEDKLAIEDLNFKQLIIEEGFDYELFNKWIIGIDQETKSRISTNLIQDLNNVSLHGKENFFEVLKMLQLFKFGMNYLSLDEIMKSDSLLFKNNRLEEFESELGILGVTLSNINVDDEREEGIKIYERLKTILGDEYFNNMFSYLNDSKYVFNWISEKLNKASIIENKDRLALFEKLYKFFPENKKELNSLPLFQVCGFQKKHRGLAELISPKVDNLPDWLKTYQVNELSDTILEVANFVEEQQFYEEIIYKNWGEIIVDNEFEDQALAIIFYKEISYYYNLAASEENAEIPMLETEGLRFIFVEGKSKGQKYYTREEIFYSPNLKEVLLEFPKTKEAIKDILELEVPSIEILELLVQTPFLIDEPSPVIKENLKNVCWKCYDKEEVMGLLALSIALEENFFTHFWVDDKFNVHPTKHIEIVTGEEQVQVEKEIVMTPYWSENEALIKYLDEKYANQYKLLPNSIINDYRAKGNDIQSLKDAGLREDTFVIDELLIAQTLNIDLELGSAFKQTAPKYQLSFLNNISNLDLYDRPYTRDDNEYLVIEIASSILWRSNWNGIDPIERKEIEDARKRFRNSVYFFEPEETIPIQFDFTNSNIWFKIDDLDYAVDTSELNASSLEHKKSIIKIVDHFSSINNSDKILGVSSSKATEFIKERVFKDYTKKDGDIKLRNVDELAFFCLYIKEKLCDTPEDLLSIKKRLKIISKELKWEELTTIYCEDFSFINEKNLLSQSGHESVKYDGLSLILKINENNGSFEVFEDIKIIDKPKISGSNFKPYFLKEELNENEKKDFIQILFEEYLSMGYDHSINIPEQIFSKESKYFHIDKGFAIKDEFLPLWLEEWLSIEGEEKKELDERKAFLTSALVILDENSEVVKIRKFLLNPLLEFETLSGLDEESKINTLRFLEGKGESFLFNEEQQNSFKELFLDSNFEKHELIPIYTSTEEDKIEIHLSKWEKSGTYYWKDDCNLSNEEIFKLLKNGEYLICDGIFHEIPQKIIENEGAELENYFEKVRIIEKVDVPDNLITNDNIKEYTTEEFRYNLFPVKGKIPRIKIFNNGEKIGDVEPEKWNDLAIKEQIIYYNELSESLLSDLIGNESSITEDELNAYKRHLIKDFFVDGNNEDEVKHIIPSLKEDLDSTLEWLFQNQIKVKYNTNAYKILKQIYDNQTNTDLLPIINSFSTKDHDEYILSNSSGELFEFDLELLLNLEIKYKVPCAELLSFVKDKLNGELVRNSFFNENSEIAREKLEVFESLDEEEVNPKKLKDTECTIDGYTQWSEKWDFRIFRFLGGDLPFKILVSGISLKSIPNKSKWQKGTNLYINKDMDVLEALLDSEISKMAVSEFKKLIDDNEDKPDDEKNKDRKRDKLLAEFKNKYFSTISDLFSSQTAQEVENIMNGIGIKDKNNQKLINYVAKLRAIVELEIDVDEETLKQESANNDGVNAIKDKEGKEYRIHSARGLFVYITPFEILNIDSGVPIIIDFGSRIEKFESLESLKKLNSASMMLYQKGNTNDELKRIAKENHKKGSFHFIFADPKKSFEQYSSSFQRNFVKGEKSEDDIPGL